MDIIIAPDGFLWFEGKKLPCKLASGGLQFHEKDPRRASGQPLFVVPFEALAALAESGSNGAGNAFIELSKQDHRGDHE